MDLEIPRAMDRTSLRRAVSARCELVAEDEFRLLGTRVLDLSSDGMLVATDTDVAIGTRVVLSLRLPRTRIWIDAEGVVTRRVRGRRCRDRSTACAVRFTRMDGEYAALLAASLQTLPPPVPHRALRQAYCAFVRQIWDETMDAVRTASGDLLAPIASPRGASIETRPPPWFFAPA